MERILPPRQGLRTTGGPISKSHEITATKDHRLVSNEAPLGILEVLGSGVGFVRRREASYLPTNNDVYVSQKLVQRFGLRTGDEITGQVGAAPGRGKSPPLVQIDTVNGRPASEASQRPNFNRLSAQHPNEQIVLECGLTRRGQRDFTDRIIDRFADYAPNMTKRNILKTYTYTARTYSQELINMRGGDIFMGALSADQVMDKHWGYRTPIKRLYMAGSACHPGGAISGGAGYIAAGLISKDLGLRPWWKPVDARKVPEGDHCPADLGRSISTAASTTRAFVNR